MPQYSPDCSVSERVLFMQGAASLSKGPNKQPMELGLSIPSGLIFKSTLQLINTAKYLILPMF